MLFSNHLSLSSWQVLDHLLERYYLSSEICLMFSNRDGCNSCNAYVQLQGLYELVISKPMAQASIYYDLI